MKAEGRSVDNLVIRGEWIGKDVEVVDSANKSLLGVKGRVVDETKHLFVIETDRGVKKVPKHLSTFRISIRNKTYDVSGDALLASPEERVKR